MILRVASTTVTEIRDTEYGIRDTRYEMERSQIFIRGKCKKTIGSEGSQGQGQKPTTARGTKKGKV